MSVKRPLDFRFPELEQSYDADGSHINTATSSWQTALDISNKRGSMYLRWSDFSDANNDRKIRVTIDGVAYPIENRHQAGALTYWIIFDFNKSVKIEHWCDAPNISLIDYLYYEYRP